MNIKIVDSHLREFLKTKAGPREIAKNLSLTSVSVERLEKIGEDFVYDIEITTNRPDLMSVIGIAKEGAAILPEFGIPAEFIAPKYKTPKDGSGELIEIENDPKLVRRVCAAVLEVKVGKSPERISDRLEKVGIRSLNNLIDVTNYVMREVGHPMHVFDYERLGSGKLIIRESKKDEEITTLDGKKYRLSGGDIVAENAEGKIVDLLGIMGLQNSVVNDSTQKILLFLDNNDPVRIRKTSMGLAIRTEAAVLNEKGVDPDLALDALYRGIELYEEIAGGEVVSKIIDIYPDKPKSQTVKVSYEKINSVIGVPISPKQAREILQRLGFKVSESEKEILVTPPTSRPDVRIPEDVIEEIARVYGYHKIPSEIPPLKNAPPYHLEKDQFFWEERAKKALKYWGFTEVYTNSMVSEEIFEGMPEDGLKIANPLSVDMLYMRKTLVPSLLEVLRTNKPHESVKIFELSSVYIKRPDTLPIENLKLAGVLRGKVQFFEVKGLIESILGDFGIKKIDFKKREDGQLGAVVLIDKREIGDIEILDGKTIDFELDFDLIYQYANLSKRYTPISKFPPIIEDLSLDVPAEISTSRIIALISNSNPLIKDVTLLDQYKNKRTFHILYQDPEKNLTTQEVSGIREKILTKLKTELKIEPI